MTYPIASPSVSRVVMLGLLVCLLFSIGRVEAQTRTKKKKPGKPAAARANYRSRHFLVHTDLPPAEAKQLLGRLETMLGLISGYWGRPSRTIIECYVVKDLSKWPPNSLPPEGRAKIQEGAGVTVSQTLVQGERILAAKSIVYATADRGTPQHEAVHAYAAQTFGRTGPLWYSEGMAEMGQYWRKDNSRVNCHPFVAEYLRESKTKTLNAIVNGVEFTGDSWQNYAWRWALCHLLANNANYRARFRPLGIGLLQKKRVSFERIYGSMAKEIVFEYQLFIKHVAPGLNAELMSWDWKKRFRKKQGSSTTSATIIARRGWQPTGLTVVAGTDYEFSARGQWQLEKEGDEIDGDGVEGDKAGRGRLVGVVMFDGLDGYELGEEFELGKFGSFAAPDSGNLYLRCRDTWTEIQDNSGKLSVRLKLKGKGSPLKPPKPEPARSSKKGKEL